MVWNDIGSIVAKCFWILSDESKWELDKKRNNKSKKKEKGIPMQVGTVGIVRDVFEYP